jgi:plastocyanin
MSALDSDEESYSPKRVLWALGAVAAVLLVVLVAALVVPLQPPLAAGGGTLAAGSVAIPSGVGANIKLNFAPSTITVVIGKNNTVTWVNLDTTTHTVTATDGSFDSGNILAGQSWSHTFTTAGTYTYYCVYHSAWMKGTVMVKSS